MKRQYNYLINMEHKLSEGRLEASTLNEIFHKHFKTKNLRMFATSKDSVITLNQLPSGRYRTPAHRVNCRKVLDRYV